MASSQIFLFATASLALIAAPGPDMIYVLTRGIAKGKKVGLLSAAGITAGILVHTLLASAGLAALFKTSPIAFLIVKYAGAGYLLFLGAKTLLSSGKSAVHGTDGPANKKTAFWQGVVTNVLNPKVALFILAFLPQFISESAASPASQMLILGSCYAAITLLMYGLLGYFTGNVGAWLKSHPKAEQWIQRFSGLVLIGLGLRLAFLQQK
ncbi:MAG TPA: LysE family translocator [Fodinibius sp.]|nr:LysE family translocator [Fodinibius sp.]